MGMPWFAILNKAWWAVDASSSTAVRAVRAVRAATRQASIFADLPDTHPTRHVLLDRLSRVRTRPPPVRTGGRRGAPAQAVGGGGGEPVPPPPPPVRLAAWVSLTACSVDRVVATQAVRVDTKRTDLVRSDRAMCYA
jgi:hypothetical protein